MDANGTRVHLLLGEADWTGRATLSGVVWNSAREDVQLEARAYEYPAAPADVPPSVGDRRGAARDRYGNWYWIAPSSTEILVRSAGSGDTSLFWSTAAAATRPTDDAQGAFGPVAVVEPPTPPAILRGLAVTSAHYLVVGTVDPGGVLVFDLHGGGPPQHLCWPAPVPFSPFDFASVTGEGVLVLDRDHGAVWMLDAAFRVVRRTPGVAPVEVFVPVDGSATGEGPAPEALAGVSASDAWPAPPDAIAIETLPGGGVAILDRPPLGDSTVHYHATLDAAPVSLSLAPHGITGHDLAFIAAGAGGDVAGEMLVADHQGNQTHAFTLRIVAGVPSLTRIPRYLPMRLFGGKALVAIGDEAYYDFAQTWIPLIEQRRPRHAAAGEVRLERIDSLEPDCVWHRVMVDGCVPEDAGLEVWSRAANTADELDRAAWQQEPRPYRRHDSELPFAPRPHDRDHGTWETLFQRATGRYLDLCVKLSGNGRSTPRLRALRVHYPRFSYLQYLPAVYRQDAESSSFLDRFLANVEGMLTGIEDRIAASQALLDVRSAPPEALEWLAGWIGLALDPTWDDRKRRLLLQHAPILFARRGTIDGLRMALALALLDCATPELFTDTGGERSPAAAIRIVEQFRTRRAPAVAAGDPTQMSGLRALPRGTSWTPAAGRDAVDAAWGGTFPLATPADPERARAWRALSEDTFGFVPRTALASDAMWRSFLARRYHGVAAFNEVYGRSGHPAIRSFDELARPLALPADGAPLLDWYDFEVDVLGRAARAHRFLVLLPVDPAVAGDARRHERMLDIARRITAIEKPAHTSFDVRFYWALFRVGEVRLGIDTIVGPRRNFLTPFVLQRSYLGESVLAPGHPQAIKDRALVTGRGRLAPPCCPTGEGS